MKKYLFLIAAMLIYVASFSQTITLNSKNNKFTGLNQFSKPVTIETKLLTGLKIATLDTLITARKDTVSFKQVGVYKKDTVNVITGSYATRHDLKIEPTKQEIVKALNSAGAGIKLAPTMAVGGAMTGNNQLVDARASYIHCTVTDTVVVTSIHYSMAIAGVYTVDGVEFNGVAIYSLSGTTATRVAISANTGTAWSIAANDFSGINLTAPVTLYPGEYYVGFLFNFLAQTTAPTIQSIQPGNLYTSMPLSNSRRLGIFYSGVAQFPTSFTVLSTQVLGILHNFIGK